MRSHTTDLNRRLSCPPFFKRLLFTLTCLLTLNAAPPSYGIDAIHVERHQAPGFLGYVPNALVVRFSDTTTATFDDDNLKKGKTGNPPLDKIGETFGAAAIHPQFPGAGKKKNEKGANLAGWHRVTFEGKVDLDSAVSAYKAQDGVVDAEPIGIHTVDATPNDGNFSYQWHLYQSSGVDMALPEAWDTQTGSADIVVAVPPIGLAIALFSLAALGILRLKQRIAP